jgi:hypothetical protein
MGDFGYRLDNAKDGQEFTKVIMALFTDLEKRMEYEAVEDE